jgi:hypothetical protein
LVILAVKRCEGKARFRKRSFAASGSTSQSWGSVIMADNFLSASWYRVERGECRMLKGNIRWGTGLGHRGRVQSWRYRRCPVGLGTRRFSFGRCWLCRLIWRCRAVGGGGRDRARSWWYESGGNSQEIQ